jgi:Rrf2 family iron-sulfur cluster assembly transcriptional regulator
MPLLQRKSLLAIAAVVNVALQKDGKRVSAKTLAARHGLPPRHLELVLQSLVQGGILKGVRGPYGGYELARERHSVTARKIFCAPPASMKPARSQALRLSTKLCCPFSRSQNGNSHRR